MHCYDMERGVWSEEVASLHFDLLLANLYNTLDNQECVAFFLLCCVCCLTFGGRAEAVFGF